MAVSLLNKTEYRITDRVTVYIPNLREYRNEDKRSMIDLITNLFLLTPSNYMLELHKSGRDFRKISEYDFFIENFFFIIYTPSNSKARSDL